MMRPDQLEAITRGVIDCGFNLHRELGPGLLETAYEALMAEAVRQIGFSAERQVPVPLQYNGVVIDN